MKKTYLAPHVKTVHLELTNMIAVSVLLDSGTTTDVVGLKGPNW